VPGLLPLQDLDGRGVVRTVGFQERENLSSAALQVDVGHRLREIVVQARCVGFVTLW
jgi:hypothetical protein